MAYSYDKIYLRMARHKDIDRFVKDVKQAAKVAGSHVPIVKEGLSAYDTYGAIQRLRKSTPKAAKAVRSEVIRGIKRRQQRLKRRYRLG